MSLNFEKYQNQWRFWHSCTMGNSNEKLQTKNIELFFVLSGKNLDKEAHKSFPGKRFQISKEFILNVLTFTEVGNFFSNNINERSSCFS